MTTQVISIADLPGRKVRRRGKLTAGSLVLPAVAVLLVFFVYPLILILWLSLSQPEIGLQNYAKLFTDGVTISVLIRTLLVGVIVAIACLLIGYPYAYAMTLVGPAWRAVMMTMVMLPFWVSVIARTFAWFILLGRGGPVESLLAALGFPDMVLLYTWGGVTVAMVQVMLPFMVLPLYNSMVSIDRRLLTASASLGAGRFTSFRKVYLPLSMPGILGGFSLVFVVTLGFYITPSLLGSPDQALMSQVIATRVKRLLDFPGAGAMGALLLVVTLLALAIVNRATRISSQARAQKGGRR